MKKSRNLIHHSADFWQKQMTHWQTSGLKQKEFCQQNNLALSTFHKWQKKLRDESQFEAKLPAPFIELSSEDIHAHSNEHKKSWDIELSLGNGLTLRLRQS